MSSNDTSRCAEFDCAECGRHIILVSSAEVPAIPLYGSCQFMPGWFRNAALRAVIAPEHDGLERLQKETAS